MNWDDAALPPQNLDAERSVIGSMLFLNDSIDEIASLITAEHFYRDAHQHMFAAIMRLHENGVRGIDPVILAEELIRKGQLEEVGGIRYIAEILEQTPHAANVRYYASIVVEKSMRREVIYTCRESVRKAYDQELEITETMGGISAKIDTMFGRSAGDARPISEVFASMKVRQANPVAIQSTGFENLDNHLRSHTGVKGGFLPGQLIIVAARPAMGKTAFGMALCEAAASYGTASLYLTLEMDGEELTSRIQRQGDSRVSEVSAKPIFMEDRQFTLEGVCASIRMNHRRRGVRLAVVDYLTLIEIDGRMNSTEKLERITKRLKQLARELKIPIVVLAQLNRDLEKRENKRPQASDLRGSGSIEQDSDVVLFLYRHEVYYQNEKPGHCEVIIAKQRAGPAGTVELGYLKAETRFVPLSEMPGGMDAGGLYDKFREGF